MTRFSSGWSHVRMVHSRLGPRGTVAYLLKDRVLCVSAALLGKNRVPSIYRLYVRGVAFPLRCRLGTTDRRVFRQIFVERDYDRIQPSSPPRLILDGGANVGHSAVYFLTRFPEARVLAVEADDRNFAMLAMNVAAYGDRATAINAAIWSHRGPLRLSRGTFMDGREWASRVVESGAVGLPVVEGIDLISLLEGSGYERINVLKLDVEGAEIPIFQHSERWIDLVDEMVVELHDSEARATFYGALPADAFETADVGDLAIASRRNYPVAVR